MKYVPNLIPSHSKVLPDYFKERKDAGESSSQFLTLLSYIGAIFFFVSAMVFILHPLVTLLFAIIGLILLPPGQQWLEKQLRFQLTPKIKAATGVLLFLSSVPLTQHYAKTDKQEALAAEQKIRLAEQKERLRQDSLAYYTQASTELEKANQPEKALQQLERAMPFAETLHEKRLVSEQRVGILATQTLRLVKAGKYQAALPQLDNLLTEEPRNPDLLYHRAICYSKIGKMQLAVTDLQTASGYGSQQAKQLHEKLNPLKKRVSYYVTRCCDGTTSNAKGRGACSHHGGVCDWNDPIYEEYRQYQ